MAQPRRPPVFSRGSWPEAQRVAQVLRSETVGGSLLIGAALIGLLAANLGGGTAYAALRDTVVGPASLRLDLSLGTWAADGLLAIFFFVVGLELKREFVAGDLRDPARAAVPIAAAVGGMVAPALIFVLLNLDTGGEALRGWAIPTATDIAFALAVLAVIANHLPTALRTFLLTLAVVDDLLAVTVIALFYTADLEVLFLLAALVPLAVFAVLVHRRVGTAWLLLPPAALTWWLVHESGVHATVAGVLLGFAVPVLRRDGREGPGLAERLEHRVRPISAGVAVPVFAFFAAGVTIGGLRGLGETLTDPVAVGIVAGLVLGKPIGILGTSWLMARLTRADLDPDLRWVDVLGMSMLAGIGFTVSLLIGELAFATSPEREEHVKLGVLAASLLAALAAAVVLSARERAYRRIAEAEQVDADADGVPDVYQRPTAPDDA